MPDKFSINCAPFSAFTLKSNIALAPAAKPAKPAIAAPIGVAMKAKEDFTKPPIPEVIELIPSFAPSKSPETNESQIPVSVPRKPPEISLASSIALFVKPSSSRYSDCLCLKSDIVFANSFESFSYVSESEFNKRIRLRTCAIAPSTPFNEFSTSFPFTKMDILLVTLSLLIS